MDMADSVQRRRLPQILRKEDSVRRTDDQRQGDTATLIAMPPADRDRTPRALPN
jgi:hypothetical protein